MQLRLTDLLIQGLIVLSNLPALYGLESSFRSAGILIRLQLSEILDLFFYQTLYRRRPLKRVAFVQS